MASDLTHPVTQVSPAVVPGRATVTLDDGRSYDFGSGDVGILRAGANTTWIVHETFRKVFIALEADDA